MIAITPRTLARFHGLNEWHSFSRLYPEILISPAVNFLYGNGQDWLLDLMGAGIRRNSSIDRQIWHIRINPFWHGHLEDTDTKKIRGLYSNEDEPYELTGNTATEDQFFRARLGYCGIPIEHFNNDFQLHVYRSGEVFGVYLLSEVEDE